ncbi:MAG: type II toxin-antitoxin system Phd/YefM family antitoxin, partial [Moorea sp. SIO4E2]
MSEGYDLAEARVRFAEIVHDAEQGKPVQITRRGKPVAIVLSLREYQRLRSENLSENLGFGATLAEFRQKYQIQALDINPDQVFNQVRVGS